MPETKPEKPFACKCSPEECQHIVKEVNNAFAILTDGAEIRRRANLFKGLGHEVRLRILGLLAVQELCTCEIVKEFAFSATKYVKDVIVRLTYLVAEKANLSLTRFGKSFFLPYDMPRSFKPVACYSNGLYDMWAERQRDWQELPA